MLKFIMLNDSNIGTISLPVDKILKLALDVNKYGETITRIYLTTSIRLKDAPDCIEVYDDIYELTRRLNK